MTKQWEINQEFGLEGMAKVVFGPQSADRAWFSSAPFVVFNVPVTSVGILNSLHSTYTYIHYGWYHMQLLLNDGNGTAEGTYPIDWPYALGFPSNDLPWGSLAPTVKGTPTGSILTMWLIKGLQAKDRFALGTGWSPYDNDPGQMVQFPAVASDWTGMPTSTKLTMMQAYLTNWFNRAKNFTPQQWYGSTVANQTVLINQAGSGMTTRIAYFLPRFRYVGVDATFLGSVAAWAQTIWPGYNWSAALNTSCTPDSLGNLQCNIPLQ
jgi:hypothetical protein